MTYDEAKRFLQYHYSQGELDADKICCDDEHWKLVAGDAVRFPYADLEFIDLFGEASAIYLASVPL